jgi:hypothetical protein
VTETTLRSWMERAERAGGLPVTGHIHRLRHTFCSHLAMRGAPAKAIQELAGHADLSTTVRYMHLSPASLNQAIQLLEQPANHRGENASSEVNRKNHVSIGSVPTEIRTLVTAVKGRCPGPLDDGDGRPHLARPSPAIHGNAQENYLPASFAAAASFAAFRPFPKTHAPSTPSS